MIETKIYYQDKVWPDDFPEGQPPPARGVQVVLQQNHNEQWIMQSASDYYLKKDDGRYRGADIFGLFDYLLETGLVLFGRTITNDEYKEVITRARKWQMQRNGEK